MSDQFIYFVCVKGNRDILKKEIEQRFKFLTPSFSKGDFLTYKNQKTPLTQKEIRQLKLAFALDWGESIGKLSNEAIEQKLKIKERDLEYPEESPSRAYLKILQTCNVFKIEANKDTNWIEFGSAPGGACYYLLNNFGNVCGVDPAVMDEICLKNERFIHMQEPVQNLSQEMLPDYDVHYITSDLNINPKQGIKEVIRLSKKYKSLKGIFYTVKLVKTDHLKVLEEFKEVFQNYGFKRVGFVQLSAHKRETLLYGLN